MESPKILYLKWSRNCETLDLVDFLTIRILIYEQLEMQQCYGVEIITYDFLKTKSCAFHIC